MQITIAVAQCEIARYETERNLRKAEQFIQQAVAQEAQIIVFPEDFVTGPLGAQQQNFVDYNGYYIQHFQRLARQYQIDIVPGSIIEGDAEGWFNTTCYIDRDGNILGRYRKVNLWHPERPYLRAGESCPVFSTAYGRVGLCICWDLAFPELFRHMVQQEVEIVICPSYWAFEDAGIGMSYSAEAEVTFVDALCVARAFEHEVVVVYANAAGSTSGVASEHLIGRSQITVPFQGVVQRLDHTHEELFVQRLNTAILQDAERVYKIRSDLARGAFPFKEVIP